MSYRNLKDLFDDMYGLLRDEANMDKRMLAYFRERAFEFYSRLPDEVTTYNPEKHILATIGLLDIQECSLEMDLKFGETDTREIFNRLISNYKFTGKLPSKEDIKEEISNFYAGQ